MGAIYGWIYLLTNIVNHKQYVGQSVVGIEERWDNHRKNARNNKKSKLLVDLAIRRYGPSNFIIKQVDICYNTENEEVDQKMLDDLEDFYIVKFDTLIPNGYNIRRGGYGGKLHESTKEKISKSHLGHKNPMFGKKFSDDHRKRLSESHKGKLAGSKHPFFGKSISRSTRKKISKSLMKQGHGPCFGRKLTEEQKHRVSEVHRGKKLSEEQLRFLKKRFKGNKNPMFGKIFSIEHRKKISEKLKGKNHPLFGKSRPESVRRKISKSNIGKHFKP